jgi:hypothetical protein
LFGYLLFWFWGDFFVLEVLKMFTFFCFVGMLRSVLQVGVLIMARKGSTIGDHLGDFRRTRKSPSEDVSFLVLRIELE